MAAVETFFSKTEQERIVAAIKAAEKETSGEIRVHIDKRCKGDVMDMAAFVFEKLEMHKTELRNGVLIYLAVKDKKFAILGDVGINKVVPENFWEEVKAGMLEEFKKGDFTNGLVKAIGMAGEKLKTYFPYQKDDINELADEISFGK